MNKPNIETTRYIAPDGDAGKLKDLYESVKTMRTVPQNTILRDVLLRVIGELYYRSEGEPVEDVSRPKSAAETYQASIPPGLSSLQGPGALEAAAKGAPEAPTPGVAVLSEANRQGVEMVRNMNVKQIDAYIKEHNPTLEFVAALYEGEERTTVLESIAEYCAVRGWELPAVDGEGEGEGDE